MTRWTDNEIKELSELFPILTDDELENKFNREIKVIKSKAKMLGVNGIKTQNRWSEEETKILYSCLHKDMTYNDILELLPNKNFKELKRKCETEKICDGIRRNDAWSQYELEKLKEIYPITENKELCNYFKGRSNRAIQAKASRLGLYKTYTKRDKISANDNKRWSEKKYSELKKIFARFGEDYTYTYFWNKHSDTRRCVKNKLIELGLLIYFDYGVKDRRNPTLRDAFVVYKAILKGEIDGFQKYIYNITDYQLIFLYKYYNKINNIKISRDYFINSTLGSILKEAKLNNLIKNRFSGYYDFICNCYPYLNLKEWELKKMDVPNGYWDNKYNRFWCIRDGINNLVKDNIITYKSESLELDYELLAEYMNGSMLYFYGKSAIAEYLDFIDCRSKYTKACYNNIFFDSFEEKGVYKFIFNNITKDIIKCRKKDFYFQNIKCNENYIPDFYIRNKNGKGILIEYFGMYKPNNPSPIFQEYCDKTNRKIEFFNSLDDIIFISLLPKDIRDNYKGVRDKLTSFFVD